MQLECSVEACTRPARTHGWCVTHYHRWRRHGDPCGEAARPLCECGSCRSCKTRARNLKKPLLPCTLCGGEKTHGGHRLWCNECAELRALQEWDTEAVRQADREYALYRSYGISIADYERMLEEQGGVCAICCGPQTKSFRHFDVDHNKETGAVRGLLCRRCNTGLGYLEAGFHVPALKYLSREG